MIVQRHSRWRSGRRRLTAGLALAAYMLTACGFPAPAAMNRHSDEPYPCQDHACGCRCAEDCWRHCCCFTPEEKLAWARANHIEPPAYAELPRGDARNESQREEAPCCSCCRAYNHHSDGKAKGRGFLIGFMAMRCHNAATAWLMMGAVAPLALPMGWTPQWVDEGRIAPFNKNAREFSIPPPVPPPRSQA